MGSTGTRSAAGADGTDGTCGTDAGRVGRNVSDGAGMILLGACAAWALITAAAHDGRPEGVLLAVLAVAAGHAAGRISGALLPLAAPCAGAVAAIACVGDALSFTTVTAGAGLLTGWATARPLNGDGTRP